MPKTKKDTNQPSNIIINQSQTPMSNQTQTSNSINRVFSHEKSTRDIAGLTVPVHGLARVESSTQSTAQRLVWYPFAPDGSLLSFDPFRDLSLSEFAAVDRALNAVLNYLDGSVQGSPTFILTAPAEKFFYEESTGAVAIVRGDYQNDLVLEVAGQKRIVKVADADMPQNRDQHHFRHLHVQAGGAVYAKPWQAEFSVTNQESRGYYYARVCGALLAGKCVSLSFNSGLAEKALRVASIFANANSAADIAQGRLQLRADSRAASKFNRLQREVEVNNEISLELNGPAVVTSERLTVNAKGGGKVDLSKLDATKPVHVFNPKTDQSWYTRAPKAGVDGLIILADSLNQAGFQVIID